ncbi:MAG: hypothetical protein RIA69_17560 [Cyclobacteriaceae bacterium]
MDKEIAAFRSDWKMVKELAIYDTFSDLYHYKESHFEHLEIIDSLSLKECFNHCQHLYLTIDGQDYFLCTENDTMLITELQGHENENRALFEIQSKDFLKEIAA